MLRLCALASGRGSNVQAIQAAIERGDLDATLALVVSNNSGSGVLAWAEERAIPCAHISGKTHPDEGAALREAAGAVHADVLVLAGYMKQVHAALLEPFEGRAVNIHPGPLPRFGGRGMFGLHVHAAVLEAGLSQTEVTVHRVSAAYDEGATLQTRAVPVLPGDTPQSLADRVLPAEHDLYWRVLDRVFVRGEFSPSRSS